jgi:hypothetical protein
MQSESTTDAAGTPEPAEATTLGYCLLKLQQSAKPIFNRRLGRILSWFKQQCDDDEDRHKAFLVGLVAGLALSHTRDRVSRHCAAVAKDQRMKSAIRLLVMSDPVPERRLRQFMESVPYDRKSEIINGIVSGLLLCHPAQRVRDFIKNLVEWPDLKETAEDILDSL